MMRTKLFHLMVFFTVGSQEWFCMARFYLRYKLILDGLCEADGAVIEFGKQESVTPRPRLELMTRGCLMRHHTV
jgi:hypothetical protein